jgi:tryptophan synthase alpha subunit
MAALSDGAIVGSAIVDCIRAVAAGKKGGAARGREIFVSRVSREAHRV